MRFCYIFLILCWSKSIGQDGFVFGDNKEKVQIGFKLINNLIFIPISVNGVELNFLLDTGVEETILLSLDDKTQVSLNNVKKIKLKGLGENNAIEGLKSTNNILRVKNLVDVNHDLYIVLDQEFNFSTHIGIPVNGIIGYHFFKNQVVEINYDQKKLFIYKNIGAVKKKKLTKFQSIPIKLELNKPYCDTKVFFNKDEFTAKVLIDIGNSDALWLFQDTNSHFKIEGLFFEDYLGRGFSGDINGIRTKIQSVSVGNFKFKKPIIAMPDSISVKSVTLVKNREGSLGAGIFKRFVSIFDYQNNLIYLKKGNYYDDLFQYNRTGLEIISSGLQWVPETVKLSTTFQDTTFDGSGNKFGSANFQYKFELKPVYEIANVRKNSPAKDAGL